METFMRIVTICILTSAFFLTSCGGGGAGSATDANNGTVDDGNPDLIFEFAAQPLHARVFNLASFSAETENHFNPGETISLIWDKDLYFSGDNPFLGLLDQYLYDSSVYLSNDTALDEGTDLKLFTVECSYPMTLDHACGETAHFQCLYAKDNANTISCTSIPLGRINGFMDIIVDTTTFLDVIPKDAHVIIKSCLREDPSNCAEANYPLKLL